jgi:hypothetical protein
MMTKAKWPHIEVKRKMIDLNILRAGECVTYDTL